MSDPSFKDWLATRPKAVQELAKKYPPGQYRIAEFAPYGISCAGTIVDLYSYTESGEVGVIVRSGNKLPSCLLHERCLAEEFGKNDPHHDKNVLVHIDPIWMEPLPDDND